MDKPTIRLNFDSLSDETIRIMAENTLHAGTSSAAPIDVSAIQKLREDLESAVSVLQGLAGRLRKLEEDH